jgi:hypothetical protein
LNELLADVMTPNTGWGVMGNATTPGTRIFWSHGTWGESSYPQDECFDFSTLAECPNWPLTPADLDNATDGNAVGANYSIRPDSTPNCVWTDSDSGDIVQWNVLTGQPGCGSATPDFTATYYEASLLPNLSCGTDAVNSWGDLSVTNVTGGSYTKAKLTILDSNGSPITGWTNVVIPRRNGTPTVSLASLPVSTTGATPQFELTLQGLSPSTGHATLTLSKTGSAPQLCVGLQAQQVCPSLSAMAAGAIPAPTNATVLGAASNIVGSTVEPTVSSSAKAVIAAPSLASCEQQPDSPTGSLSVPDQRGALTLHVTPPANTGGATPSSLQYMYTTDIDSGNWYPLTLDAKGAATLTGLGDGNNYCVYVFTINLAGVSQVPSSFGCADTHPLFSCSSPDYFEIVDGQLYQGTDAVADMSAVGSRGSLINAMGYDPSTQLLYGVLSGPTQTLYEIMGDGTQIALGPISGLPPAVPGYVAGDFNRADGKLYVSAGGASLYAIDLTTRVATPVTVPLQVQLAGGIGQDFVIGDDGWLYSVNQKNLVAMSLTSGDSDVQVLPKAVRGSSPPAMWISGSGIAWSSKRGTASPVFAATNPADIFLAGNQAAVSLGRVSDGASC